MKFFRLDPEAAGGLARMTVMDRSTHPPLVTRLHYEFDGWLGDELLQSFPCFIVTQALASSLAAADLTGTSFDLVIVTVSQQFRDMYGDRALPEFSWLKVCGRAGADDFGVDNNNYLVVSERALRMMNLKHCIVQEWPAPSNGQGQPT